MHRTPIAHRLLPNVWLAAAPVLALLGERHPVRAATPTPKPKAT